MPRGTENSGRLAVLKNCKIITPCGTICLRILPDISDSKSAHYAPENAIGRSNPLITYAYSEPRMITTELHFMTTTTEDINDNWRAIRIIQSLVYPGTATVGGGAPFTPPPVVKFICGGLLDGSIGTVGTNGLCLILKSYNIRYPTNVAWDEQTYLPYQFSISCNWEVVYACKNLPSNNCVSSKPCTSSGPQECQPVTGVGIPYASMGINQKPITG
jgi:hypothetical protein